MSSEKENNDCEQRSHFIRYLYNEGIRKGFHTQPNFYSSLIEFSGTPQGIEAFNKFKQINPEALGILSGAPPSRAKRILS